MTLLNRQNLALLIPLIFGLVAAPLARADVYFVAPPQQKGDSLRGSTDPLGSETNPFTSLDEALSAASTRASNAAGGSDIRLLAGDYGDLRIKDAQFDEPVTIAAAPDKTSTTGVAAVHLTLLTVIKSHNLVLADLQVWPDTPSGDISRHLVSTDAKSTNITFLRLDVRSRPDAATYPNWTKSDWETWHRAGLILNGADSVVADSRFTGLSFGIITSGARARVEGNIVQGFSGDALRGLGDGSVFRANRVEDCVQINKNHADGFQSWSRSPDRRAGTGTVRGLTIEGNVFREWTQAQDNPLRCSLQGIGMFDGMYEDILIQNNAISVSAYHGISVAGGINVRIVHNTLVNARGLGKEQPWISVSPHKKGALSEHVIIANNIAPRIRLGTKVPGPTITQSQNLIVLNPVAVLMSPLDGDLRPKPGSAAIDAADPAYATATDIAGQPRGERPDIGAWESP